MTKTLERTKIGYECVFVSGYESNNNHNRSINQMNEIIIFGTDGKYSENSMCIAAKTKMKLQMNGQKVENF